MLSSLMCGSFENEDRSRSSRRRSKNRYSNLGLDKFNALLSELEEQKQKIYTQMGAQDIALIQFDISTHNQITPIVIKRPTDECNASSQTTLNILQVVSDQLDDKHIIIRTSQDKKKKRPRGSLLERPLYYLPLVVILILLFLAIHGRPFAILSTCIGWYLIPIIRRGGDNNDRMSIYNNDKRKLKRKKLIRSIHHQAN